MALPSSGALSLNQIQTEFGGSNPISLSEYYSVAGGVPSSGTISINNFYGTSALTLTTNPANGTDSDLAVGAGNTATATVSITSNLAVTWSFSLVSGDSGWVQGSTNSTSTSVSISNGGPTANKSSVIDVTATIAGVTTVTTRVTITAIWTSA